MQKKASELTPGDVLPGFGTVRSAKWAVSLLWRVAFVRGTTPLGTYEREILLCRHDYLFEVK